MQERLDIAEHRKYARLLRCINLMSTESQIITTRDSRNLLSRPRTGEQIQAHERGLARVAEDAGVEANYRPIRADLLPPRPSSEQLITSNQRLHALQNRAQRAMSWVGSRLSPSV